MTDFPKESALLDPVRSDLLRHGYRQQREEVQFFEYSIDLYGYATKNHKTTAVELKLTRWRRAFEQALVYQLCADFVYIAMPFCYATRVEIPLLERNRLGLLGVRATRDCVLLLKAKQSTVIMPRYRSFYIQLMREREA